MPSYNVNTDLVNGNSLMLYITSGATNTPIAFAKTCDLQISTNVIDTTNKMSGNFKSILSGQISWTVNSDFMYTKASGISSYDTLLQYQLTGANVSLTVGTTTNTTTFEMTTGLYSGTAKITSLSLKAEDNSIVSCSVTLEGSGALTKVI